MRILARFALPAVTVAALAVTADAVAQHQTPRFRDDLQVAGAEVKGSTSDHFMTFSGPFSLPGVTLPAGTYVFQKPSSGVLRVMSSDRRTVYAAIHATEMWRSRTTDAYSVIWEKNVAGAPPRLKAWFASGRNIGQELAYPAIEAPRLLASR